LVDQHPEAVQWLGRIEHTDARAMCPDLLYAEVANAVLAHQRAGRLTHARGREVLDAVAAVPFERTAIKNLMAPAWMIALERGLTAYDACYVALAETTGATLVTADRALAAATEHSVLINS
jgi:predicted nucleic acid-binding protein